MQRRSPWKRPFWGPISSTVATVGLAIFGFMERDKRPWPLIILVALFLVVHSLVNAAAGHNVVARLGNRYDDIQRRSVQVVADLGQLAGDHFGSWIVDLYLFKSNSRGIARWPFLERKRELSRQLSVSLLEVSEEPSTVSLDDGVYGKCFNTTKPLVWLNDASFGGLDDAANLNGSNLWHSLSDNENTEMSSQYGVLSVSPIVDQLNRHCLGVLAVHVKAGRDELVRARGAIVSIEGRRRVHNACVDLYGMLAR